ncbi:MAG: hypothetical protein MZV70_15965 [Desulfobacterales bacterium]|nr:hypothetical protein [Desulfobacterales bacterium]
MRTRAPDGRAADAAPGRLRRAPQGHRPGVADRRRHLLSTATAPSTLRRKSAAWRQVNVHGHAF